MKSSLAVLRGGADAANLLVDQWTLCGKAFYDTIGSGKTLSVVMKYCAVAYYAMGHEIGHNIGLSHEIAMHRNKHYPHGHAHYISHSTDSESKEYITILGGGEKKTVKVNYYSNPDIIYPLTGTATGVAGIANNARILMENRFALANIGDESTPCSLIGTIKCLNLFPLYYP